MAAADPSTASSAAGASTTESSRLRRPWTHVLVLVVNVVAVSMCFATAVGLVVAHRVRHSLHSVDLADPAVSTTSAPAAPGTGDPSTTGPVETFPPAEPGARNFLITGADNDSCIDPSSPYYGGIGQRSGQRSDTIMVMRVDNDHDRAAVLSFPRDLWVKIAGGGKGRINSAYVRDEPQRLVDTLYDNFGIRIDHFIQVDFCAFRTIVDAVGGVSVPFDYPARDKATGLDVPEAGCHTFDGDSALAYVRSRKYQYFDGEQWRSDPTSDLGRISRQQDFLRRVMTAALDRGVLDVSVARGLIEAARENVVTDTELSVSQMLQFAGILRDLEPASVPTFQVDGSRAIISGNDVLEPRLDTDNMRAVLAIFRGEAAITMVTPTDETPDPSIGTVPSGTEATSDAAPDMSPDSTPGTSGPPAEENTKGIAPDRDARC